MNSKKQRKLLSLSLLSLCALLLSCDSQIEDVPLCKELNPAKAFCVRIISGRQFYIDDKIKYENKTWWEMRPTNIQMPASTWSSIKKTLIKTCKGSHKCEETIASWDRTVVIIDSTVNGSPLDISK